MQVAEHYSWKQEAFLPKGGKFQFSRGNSHKPRKISQKTRKGWILKKLAPKSKLLDLNSTNLMLNSKKSCLDCTKKPDPSISYGLKLKHMTIKVLNDSGSSGDLLSVKKWSINSLTAKSVLAGEKLVATYSIST
jgi:hypothetical protein